MSWQTYVDDHLMCALPNGGQLAAAAILGHDGGVWAQSDTFPDITGEQVSNIMSAFSGPNFDATLAQKGLFLGGNKYLVVAGDPGEVIRGKKGSGGATVKKTSSALVIGLYSDAHQAGDANVVVEQLGDYLIGQGM
ncbi:hypothetical protein WJX84_004144 [Apatococcus fuscideae]|uniref:Profilin n=1 Tax=Apatococcus fuscideae TaxID=2026836 RepID=A0AAW1REG5_9CHLO